jgi:hypothetical protein
METVLNQGEKRVVEVKEKKGLSLSDVMLIGILLAAGAVLKFFVGSVINFGMKPNFIIAMYCLIVLLIRPKVKEAVIIGILAGAICQFFPGTPYINFVSEILGAVTMCLLTKIKLPVKNAADIVIKTTVNTFLSTLVSGFAFVGMMYLLFYTGANVTPTPLAIFLGIIFGTATINAVIVLVLYPPLKRVLKK